MSGVAMRTVGLIVGTGLALAACTGSTPDRSDSGSSSGSPTPSQAGTATASASLGPSLPVKPERPEAMDRDDAKGAAATAEYFIELYPYVMATGDTEEFEAMSHRACGFCDDALEQAEKIKESGYAYTGGESALSVTEVYAKDEVTGVFPLDADISQQASKILNGSGGQVFVADAKVSRSRVEVGLRNGQWVVVTIAPIPEN